MDIETFITEVEKELIKRHYQKKITLESMTRVENGLNHLCINFDYSTYHKNERNIEFHIFKYWYGGRSASIKHRESYYNEGGDYNEDIITLWSDINKNSIIENIETLLFNNKELLTSIATTEDFEILYGSFNTFEEVSLRSNINLDGGYIFTFMRKKGIDGGEPNRISSSVYINSDIALNKLNELVSKYEIDNINLDTINIEWYVDRLIEVYKVFNKFFKEFKKKTVMDKFLEALDKLEGLIQAIPSSDWK